MALSKEEEQAMQAFVSNELPVWREVMQMLIAQQQYEMTRLQGERALTQAHESYTATVSQAEQAHYVALTNMSAAQGSAERAAQQQYQDALALVRARVSAPIVPAS